MFPQQLRTWTIETTPPLISRLRAAASPEGRSLLERAFPLAGEGGRGSDRGRMRGDVSAAAPYMDNRDNAAPHQPPAGGSFSRREKPFGRAFPREGEGGRGSDRGRMRGDVSAAAPYMDNRDNAAPHQPPAGGSFPQREKPFGESLPPRGGRWPRLRPRPDEGRCFRSSSVHGQ